LELVVKRRFALLGFVLLACAHQTPASTPTPVEPPPPIDYGRGLASFYGEGFDGKPTANGELFNARALTAAHKTLPFGTCVRVEVERTGRSVNVRINDRGPYVQGRIIDLSEGAAKLLGIQDAGVVGVRLSPCH
jgi:rare lipoprotein A